MWDQYFPLLSFNVFYHDTHTDSLLRTALKVGIIGIVHSKVSVRKLNVQNPNLSKYQMIGSSDQANLETIVLD